MEEKSKVKIAEVIARERKKHNMTQKELGDTLHISPQAVSKWETGLAEPDSET
ncbi:MAG: helix-turn-helix domain-containing protein, partial [Clostridiales bacterium]|nr:helix-turn-helix domain-containing protein [Clostridiales bacterium]